VRPYRADQPLLSVVFTVILPGEHGSVELQHWRDTNGNSEFPVALGFLLIATWPLFLGLLVFAWIAWGDLAWTYRAVAVLPSIVMTTLLVVCGV